MASFHDLVVLILGRGLQVLAGLITIKAATSLMSPAQVGAMNQVMSLAILGPSALLIPVAFYIQRTLFEWLGDGTLGRSLITYLRVVLVLAIAFGFLGWILQNQTSIVSEVSAEWVGGLIVLYLVGFSIHTMGSAGLNLLGHRLQYVVFSNIAVWGGLAFALYFSRDSVRPEMWLLGICCGFLVSSISYVLLYRQARNVSSSTSTHDHALTHARETFLFNRMNVFMFVWPQALVYGFWWIQSQSYRFILDRVADIASVGLFAAGYMICSVPIQTFETLFNEFYSPTLFRALKGKDAVGMAQAWNAYASAYIPSVILFGSFVAGNAGFLVKILLGEQFQAVTPILILPALTETMRAISSSLHMLGVAKVDTTVYLPPVVTGAIISPILVTLLAAQAPLLGTAIALFIAGGVAFATVIPVSYRALPISWPTRRIMTAVALGLLLGFMGLIMDAVLGELTEGKALIGLAVSGVIMLFLQYVLSKEWLREVRPAVAS